MTEIVKQTDDYSCGWAALAMALGLASQAEAEKVVGRGALATQRTSQGEVVGLCDFEILRVLAEQGVPAFLYLLGRSRPDVGQEVPEHLRIIVKHEATWSEIELEYQLSMGRRAILAVQSLNDHGGGHWIYWDGAQVLDPSNRKTYDALNMAAVDYAIVIVGQDEAGP